MKTNENIINDNINNEIIMKIMKWNNNSNNINNINININNNNNV